MPYLGRRDSDYADMGISAAAAAAAATTPLEDRVSELIARVAHDDADQHLLLEALGLTATVDDLAAAG